MSPVPVDANTALLALLTEGARQILLQQAVYAECNNHLTKESEDLRRQLRAAEMRILELEQAEGERTPQ